MWRVRIHTAALLLLFSTVAAAQVALVLGIAPNSGSPGQALAVEVKGVAIPTNITASQVRFGEGISITSIQKLPSQTMIINGETVVVDAIRVSLNISASATPGVRRVNIGSLGGFSVAVFHVTGQSTGTEPTTDVTFLSRRYPVHADAPEGLAAVDVDNNRLMDLVVAPEGDRSLSLFRALPGGNFAPPRKIHSNIFGSAFVATADFNGDGKTDLVTGSRSSATVGVWIATAATWRRPTQPVLSAPAWAVATGDFNGDGAQDIVAAVRDFNQVALLPGNGNGTFRTPILRPVGDTPKSLAVADFNRDGLSDVVVGNFTNRISILLGNRTSGLSAQRMKNAPVTMENLIAADFNGDGNTDVATIGENSILIYRGKGNGDFFMPPRRIRLSNYVWDLAAADFNGDGKTDLAFVNFAADQVSVLIAKGNLQYETPFSFPTQDIPTRILAADFNNDGKADIAVTNYGSDSISVFLNRILAP